MAHRLPRLALMARTLSTDTCALAVVLASVYAYEFAVFPAARPQPAVGSVAAATSPALVRPPAPEGRASGARRPGVVHAFERQAPTPSRSPSPSTRKAPRGTVRVEGGVLVDDDGPFWAIGATYMAAPWFYKFDRARLERNLAFLAGRGIDYVRVLGEVGGPFWQGREIDPRWPDYDQVVAGLTDLAYDKYGLRVQWTVFGGVDFSPTPARRQALVDRVVKVIEARPQKVMLLEIGNEAWKNGFSGERGRAELRGLAARAHTALRARGIALPVAPTAPPTTRCADVTAFYGGLAVDLATLHFSRDVSGPERGWTPVVQPARHPVCPGAPPIAVNNEPIGPRSSMVSEEDPLKLVSAALVTFLSRMPLYVFHSRAGVRGDIEFASLPNVEATLAGFGALHRIVPRNVTTAAPVALDSPDTMLELRSPVTPDLAKQEGVVAYQAVRLGSEELSVAVGVRGPLTLRARRAVDLEAYDLLTGDVVRRPGVGAGATVSLDGREAWFVRARP
jgi:hypothetical protein